MGWTLPRCSEQRLATDMDEKDRAGFMAAFASAAEPVEVHFRWCPLLADPDDEIVLEARGERTVESDRQIVTHNVRHFQSAAGEFGIEVVTPGATARGGRSLKNCSSTFAALRRYRRPPRISCDGTHRLGTNPKREWGQVPGMCRVQTGCARNVPWIGWFEGWQALQVIDL